MPVNISFIINKLFFSFFFRKSRSLNVTSCCCFCLNSLQFVYSWSKVTETGQSWCLTSTKQPTSPCVLCTTLLLTHQRGQHHPTVDSTCGWQRVQNPFLQIQRGHLSSEYFSIKFLSVLQKKTWWHGSFVGDGFVFCFLKIWNHSSSWSKGEGKYVWNA